MTVEQESYIRKYYRDRLDMKNYKILHMLSLDLGIGYFVGRWKKLTEEHIQIAKEVLLEIISDEFFGGCDPTFENEASYNWWNELKLENLTPIYKKIKNPNYKGGWNKEEDPLYIDDINCIIDWEYKYNPPEKLFEL